MAESKKSSAALRNPHCLVLSYPTQGHLNPMLQFSKRLQHKGIAVTLATTRSMSNTIHHAPSSSIALDTISDGYDEGGIAQAESIEYYLERFWKVGPETLTELVQKLNASVSGPLSCIVYDAFLPWALDVARKFGLVGAVFFTMSCAVDSILYHVHKGVVKLPLAGGEAVRVPGLPPLEVRDMPSFISDLGSYPAFFKMVVHDQFTNVEKADCVLCNTIYELEKEEADYLSNLWPLRTIGPTIPSTFLDKQIEEDKDYGFSIFRPNINALNWLKHRPKGSVIYVSFGSMAVLKPEQMSEVALALKNSTSHFLWVVRASEETKLPESFSEEISDKGLVVTWCPQLEVLADDAVGCFLTNCGWNSTLEALSSGVPMLALPQWTDQSTNARYIMDVWKIGLRAEADEGGIVRREEIERCTREIMEGEISKEVKENSKKWKKLAREAMGKSGSSDKNINEFIDSLVLS
ncbi:hypothetical protein SLEP1_g10950 [Rubroshorea leprosula]|uniref:Glycosyltransferase n=1 Tax=Rubroshorea leprosula TaxID=152421 RepID=A0AAV5IFM1_9ROSI|nr:hypothetical protein SLEP1_g10950 [Rubroshorea leprosula]